MKALKKSIFALLAILMGVCFTACSDANEYEDSYTDNMAWGSLHPKSLEGTSWVRANGAKVNAYGEEVQGFVEAVNFISETECVVKMSKGIVPESMKNSVVWVDDSNTEDLPFYEYNYNNTTGEINIMKVTTDSKGKVSKTSLFIAVANIGGFGPMMTVSHFGDTPSQSYLTKK